jgi:hypothetical protein
MKLEITTLTVPNQSFCPQSVHVYSAHAITFSRDSSIDIANMVRAG